MYSLIVTGNNILYISRPLNFYCLQSLSKFFQVMLKHKTGPWDLQSLPGFLMQKVT